MSYAIWVDTSIRKTSGSLKALGKLDIFPRTAGIFVSKLTDRKPFHRLRRAQLEAYLAELPGHVKEVSLCYWPYPYKDWLKFFSSSLSDFIKAVEDTGRKTSVTFDIEGNWKPRGKRDRDYWDKMKEIALERTSRVYVTSFPYHPVFRKRVIDLEKTILVPQIYLRTLEHPDQIPFLVSKHIHPSREALSEFEDCSLEPAIAIFGRIRTFPFSVWKSYLRQVQASSYPSRPRQVWLWSLKHAKTFVDGVRAARALSCSHP